MNRTEAYAFIKSHEDLKATISSNGKNFTNLPTSTLIEYIDNYQKVKTQLKKEVKKTSPATTKEIKVNNDSLSRLIEVLGKKRILIAKEIEYILG